MSRLTTWFSDKNYNRWCIISFVLIGLICQYPGRVNDPPNMWRSSDCASIAYHYYYYQNPFTEPKILHILNDDGQSVGECPILYYLVAQISKVIGYHEFTFRVLVLLFWMFGFRFLLGIGHFFSNRKYEVLGTTLLVSSFPLLSWYAFDTMPDIPALSLSLGGFYFFLQGTQGKQIMYFFLSGLLFSLGTLMKLHVVLGPLAILSLAGGMWVLPKWFKPHHGIRSLYILFLLLPVITAKLWNGWANHYNDTNHIQFFGTRNWPGWPLWEANSEQISSTFSVFANQIFNIPGVFALILIIASLLIILNKIRSNTLAQLIAIYILAVLAFSSYVFFGLRDNDYYFINLLQPAILGLMAGIPFLFEKYKKYNWIFFILLAGNIFLSASTNHRRMKWGSELKEAGLVDGSLKKYIESKGVTNADRVLVTPDYNPDLDLYLLKKKGGSNYASLDPGTDIQKIRNQRFKYIISMGGEEDKNPILKEIIKNCTLIGSHQTSKLYIVNPASEGS